MLHAARGLNPTVGNDCFLAPSAELIGDVRLGRNVSVWFNCTLRGDVMPITIGDETNIQDNTVIHGTHQKCAAVVGRRVTIGHGVILHGCEIGDLVLVGMGSIIMDRARVPTRSVVGAGSLITEGAHFAGGQLILGRPAKAVRALTEKELAFLDTSANNYLEYARWYK